MEFVADGLHFTVQGVAWKYHEKAYLMLHKPAGYECSQKPSTYPSIYTLLPAPIRQRGGGAAAGVQAVGRLDQDTTGLLLLSDDGKFIHRMSSPKHHVPKVYEVTAKHPVNEQQIAKLLAGVVLDDDPKPVRAAACQQTGELQLSLTLTEGKYHQVKRMIAAVGNRVEDVGGLHRSRIGSLALPADLKPGDWRWLTAQDLLSIAAKPIANAYAPRSWIAPSSNRKFKKNSSPAQYQRVLPAIKNVAYELLVHLRWRSLHL